MQTDLMQIFREACSQKVSDLHFLPQDGVCILYYRLDGRLKEKERLNPAQYQEILTRIKGMSQLDIGETRLPQDGRIRLQIENKNVDFRIATLPTIFGEKLTIRIMQPMNSHLTPEQIFTHPEDLANFKKTISHGFGLVLFCGKTGSGKTTTAYTAIQELAKGHKLSIHSVEDPVEYTLPAVAQTQIQPKFGMGFPSAIRAVLRHDPDVLFVSEVRDQEAMDLILKAVVTGHLVISSLHVADSISAAQRLLEIGISPYMAASALSTVVSQTLLRRVCKDCCQEITLDEQTALHFGMPEGIKIKEARGCDSCNHTGYRGRMAIYEFLHFNKAMKDLIRTQNLTGLQEHLVVIGHKTLRDRAREAVIAGHTTIEELSR